MIHTLVSHSGVEEFIPVNTLENLIHENEDIGKNITYLKIDIEGTEFNSFENWFQTDIFKNVDQLGMEIHIHPIFYNVFNVNVQKWFAQLHTYILKLGFLYVEYIRKHAVRLLRLREQHTPPHSVVVIVISLQLMHFLIHISWWKVN